MWKYIRLKESIDKEVTKKEKFYSHFFVMKHKSSPDVFLPENKMRET